MPLIYLKTQHWRLWRNFQKLDTYIFTSTKYGGSCFPEIFLSGLKPFEFLTNCAKPGQNRNSFSKITGKPPGHYKKECTRKVFSNDGDLCIMLENNLAEKSSKFIKKIFVI